MRKNRSVMKELDPKVFIALTVAGIINAFGVTIFLFPVKLYDSGISGLSMLLDQVTPSGIEANTLKESFEQKGFSDVSVKDKPTTEKSKNKLVSEVLFNDERYESGGCYLPKKTKTVRPSNTWQ